MAKDEYYHILNRGNNKQPIFADDNDRFRLLFSILYFQSPKIGFSEISSTVKLFKRKFVLETYLERIVKTRAVELIAFTLMPNHFHLLLHQRAEGGISKYMQRIQNSYTKYFNTRHQRTGHLFQGAYKAIRIESNEQLLYLSAYIHRNPREIGGWTNQEHKYPWSSYKDYLGDNRWKKLLNPSIVLDQYKSAEQYRQAVKSSGAKEDLNQEIKLEE